MYSNIFIISGPSGAGEDSIIEKLSAIMPIERVITTTTRAMREGESQGHPYYFISQEEFQNGINEEKFAEYAQQYNDNFYGVTREELNRAAQTGKTALWKIEYQGVMSVKKILPKIKSIFITVSSLDVLTERLRHRGGATEIHIAERMKYTQEWMKHTDIYDYTVVNEQGKLDEAVEKVRSIIQQGK
ncbi:MAG: guanylate kinase [Candidatus Moranbacteria bacterium]|nr:guanylate kinase [Candidatus Moranbacteria bacterium]